MATKVWLGIFFWFLVCGAVLGGYLFLIWYASDANRWNPYVEKPKPIPDKEAWPRLMGGKYEHMDD